MANPPEPDAPVRFMIKVVPGATRSEIAGWLGEHLKLRVSAAPEKGRANEAVVALVADALGLHKSAVRIVGGKTSARKTLEIIGMDASTIGQKLGSAKK